MDMNLRINEFNEAVIIVIKLMQMESFNNNNNNTRLSGFNIFIDKSGLMRLKTRLTPQESEDFFQCPILLDGNHELSKKLILETHKQNHHAGLGTVIVKLREKYWILRCRQSVKKVLAKCVTCKRHHGKNATVAEGVLPENRIKVSAPFEIAGMDLAGPLTTREGHKNWIVLYTCAVFRAVHLDVVQSLTTEALSRSMRRFIARRGRPKTMYSDRGTNIVGMVNSLNKVNWTTLESEFKIEWNFIPPTAPWWGGWWERLVRVTKDLLKKTLGSACITVDELQTLLCEVEATINNRPLTYLSEDPNELAVLTPSLFLQPQAEIITTDFDEADLGKRAQYLCRLRAELKKRFLEEYIAFLNNKCKNVKTKLIKVGDLVLIGDAGKRIQWPLGRVVQVFQSRDGKERVAKLKTKFGEITRPYQRLYPLELSYTAENQSLKEEEAIQLKNQTADEDDEKLIGETPKELRTRAGRMVRRPKKLDI